MNPAGQIGCPSWRGVGSRHRVHGRGEVVRLLTDLLDPDVHPAAELATLYHERWEVESSYRQIKSFQRGRQQVLRSASPDLARQEVWAHLTQIRD
jgi:IS4 transposase